MSSTYVPPLARAADDAIVAPEERADVVIYTLRWATDQPAAPTEETGGLLYSRVFVNGTEVQRVSRTRVEASGDFMRVSLELFPTAVKVVPLDEDAWNALGNNEIREETHE